MKIDRIVVKSILILFGLFVFMLLSVFLFHNELTFEKKIDSRVFVLEGWIPEEALNKALGIFKSENYEYIFVTGHQLQPEITLYINSYLIIHHVSEIGEDSLVKMHTIRINAESTLGQKDSAHFVLWLNDRAVADFYTSDSRGDFVVSWEGRLINLDSVMVEFDNDKVSQFGDRNLRINSVSINEKDMLRDSPARFIDRGRPFGKSRWNVTADSYAALAANFFTGNGIDPSRVISVPNYSNKRRTYGNAIALRKWFDENDFTVESVNIVSTHHHSRRTWMMYNSLLKHQMDVGIISLDIVDAQSKTRLDQFKTIARESIALMYYIIFIIPWV
jgi:hypothetical protein